MRIKEITFDSFKRFKHFKISGLKDTVKLVILVGPNGCGKSSVFEGLNHWYKFFRNLVLGERNQMKSRFLLIGLDLFKRSELERGQVGHDKTKRRSEKSGQKTVDRLLGMLQAHPHLTQMGLVKALGISSRSTVQKHLANLKNAGRIRRVGPDKGGHWEVLPT